ncbi:MAG: VTT domain-containing protein [Candidatus Margulisiibacteriota bacterium]
MLGTHLLDMFLHLDQTLSVVIADFGFLTHLILFAIIFCETGLVIAPFLPGDSLLFAAGAFSATGSLNGILLFFLLSLASVLGDNLNYWIGRFLGNAVAQSQSRLINKKHIEKTHAFFEEHGDKVVIFARFLPIVRTFAPFVAGIGRMQYRTFFAYSCVGGVLWVGVCLAAGYFFGNLLIVKNNFGLVILAIILISLLPAILKVFFGKKSV